jgi:putative MATE family efflux protein
MKLEGKSLCGDFFRFIIPSLAAQWVYALYTMIDGLFVARGVSELALSAVNIAMPFVTFLFSVALCFSVGSSTIIAMYLGEGKEARAREVFTQNMLSVTAISLIITGIVLWQSGSIAVFLGAGPETIDNVRTYLVTIAGFAFFFICSYSLEVLIKTDGYPAKATIIVTLGAVMNCVLDFLFVIVWKKGVWGAAFATGFSQLLVVLCYLTHFCSSRTHMKLVHFHFEPGLLFRTVKIGISSGITEFSAGIVIFLFNHSILKWLGEASIVSYTIVTYVSTIVVMSMAGIAQGIQPLVSYYYGKKAPGKYQKLLKYALCFGTVFSVLVFFVSRALAEPLAAVFISESLPKLRAQTVQVFGIFSWSFLLCGFNIIIGGYFTAIEYPKSAMAISLGRGFLFVALSLEVLTALFGADGIWWAAVLSELLCLILTLLLLWCRRRGLRRRHTKPRPDPS